MSKDLQKTEKNDTYTKIAAFIRNPDEIVLSSKEEIILDRWRTCAVELKANKLTTDEIIDKVVRIYSVSRFTARNDIGYAIALDSESRDSAKEFWINNVIDDLRLTIQKWKLDKSLAPFVPKLYHEYILAIKALPDAVKNRPKPKVVNNFYLVPGQNIEIKMSFDDAMAEADKIISDEEKEYTDYEDLTDDSTND